jgi:hypothetical protein
MPRSYSAVARFPATAASGSKKGVCVDESRNKVVEVTVGSDNDDENWEDLVPSDEELEEHIGDVDAADDAAAAPSPSEAVDDEGSEVTSAASLSSSSLLRIVSLADIDF